MKYIFVDVDGTLLDYSKRLPESAIKAIRQTRALGNKVFICTGRSKAEIFDQIWDIGLDGAVLGNGAYVEIEGKEIFHKLISKEDSYKIVKHLIDKKMDFYLESNNGLFASERFEEKADVLFKKHALALGREDADEVNTRNTLHGLVFNENIYRDDLNKISYILNSYDDYLEMSETFPNLNNGTWGGKGLNAMFGDIGVKGVNKGTGVKTVLDYYGADKKDSISFGDARVDIPMFSATGVSVCMENGQEEILLEADYITSDVKDDGLYKGFKHFNLI